MQLSFIHICSLIGTLIVVVVLGLYAARKVKNATDFTVGGHSTGTALVAGTIVGTVVGGASTVGTAQLAFTVGLSAWWFTLGSGIALVVLGTFYAKPLRVSGLQTISQFLVKSYGKPAGPICSITSSVGIFFSLVANILSTLPLVIAVFSLNATQASGVIFFLIVVYVFFGGVWGTGLVGIFKAVVLYFTLIIVAVLAYKGVGGITGLTGSFSYQPWFNIFGRGFWVDFGSGLSLVVGVLSTQTYIQAAYSARDAKTAQLGAIVAGLVAFPIGLPSVLVGFFMKIHHPGINPIDALPLFIINYLPHWVGGIAIAAIMVAAVGSAAGLVLGIATMVSRDLISNMIKRPTDVIMLKISRISVLVVTLTAVLVSSGNLKSLVLEWNYLSMGLRGAGIFLPLTLAIFLPGKLNGYWALWSMAGGAAAATLWKLTMPKGIDPLYIGLIICAIFLFIAFLRQKKETRID